jgi:hypothetical protein
MAQKIIEGREKVVEESKNQINKLISEIEQMIKGSESEYLFHVVYIYPNLFASLTKPRPNNTPQTVYNKTWFRAINGLTLALNKILPKFLPLKHLDKLDLKKLEKIFDNNYLLFVDTCYNIGIWDYCLKNKYVDKIVVENGEAKPYSQDDSHLFQEYVDKASVGGDKEWWGWFSKKPVGNERFISALNNYCEREYEFGFYDLVNASLYFEDIVKSNTPIVPKNEIRVVFTKNIRSYKADRLLKALTFSVGKDLYKSPLIPLKGGYFLIAKWVFSLEMHFDSWLKPIIEDTNILGMYFDFAGNMFEEYVEKKIEPVVDTVRRNITITERKYPAIRPYLDEMGKEGQFEIDIIATRGKFAFIVSCKGGKKELPKLRISRMWGEFSEREISNRIQDNKRNMWEILTECNCIATNSKISEDLGTPGKELVPIVIYSAVQPLSLSELKNYYNAPDVVVSTPNELVEFINDFNPHNTA